MSDNVQSKEEMLEALGDISEGATNDPLSEVQDINDVDIFADGAVSASSDKEVVPDLKAEEKVEGEVDPVEEVEKEIEAAPKEEESIDDPETEEKVEATPDIQSIDDIKEKTFKIKVDGKEVEITGAEMARRASGDIAVEKRLYDVDKREKEVHTRELSHKDTLDKYKGRFDSGDIYGALSEMFETPAYLIKDKMISSLGPEFERRSQMTADQLNLQRKLDEGKYYKNSYESEVQRQEEEQKLSAIRAEENALNQEISEAQETHNISEEAWDAAFGELDKTLDPSLEITSEMVVENFLNKQSNDNAPIDVTSTVNSVLSNYEEHINDNFRQQFSDFVKLSPDLTTAELNEIVKSSIAQSLKTKLGGGDKKPDTTEREEFLKRQEDKLINDLKDPNQGSDTNWF